MNNQLATTGPDLSRADMFFDRPFIVTDWDQARHEIKAGLWKSTEIVQALKALEPLAEHDPRDLQHWQQQQYLRLTLLHEAGKPLLSNVTCEECGSRKADPLYGAESKYTKRCLHCEEENEQTYNGGSRGSCEFVQPRYNPRSLSWGLLYYQSHAGRHDNVFLLWLADFYKTRQEAQAAIQPVKHYIDWLNIKYNGMLVHWMRFTSFIDMEDIMAMKLPLTPEEFRAVLRSKIEAHMAQEQNVMSYYVSDALKEHDRKEKDE